MNCGFSSLLNIATRRRSVAARPAVAANDHSTITPSRSTACSNTKRVRLPRKMCCSALSSNRGCSVPKQKCVNRRDLQAVEKKRDRR